MQSCRVSSHLRKILDKSKVTLQLNNNLVIHSQNSFLPFPLNLIIENSSMISLQCLNKAVKSYL